MAMKAKFIKSVDEGAFTRLKQNATHAMLREKGSNHNTIEHVANSQLNAFNQASFPLSNRQQNMRSSTITKNSRKQTGKRNQFLHNQSLESSSNSQLAANAHANQNAHTSIVVRNQINIINNGSAATTTQSQGKVVAGAKQASSQSQPITGNNRSKVSTRKPSGIKQP